MTFNSISVDQLSRDNETPAAPGRELSDDELLFVSGGNSTYSNALTIAAGFVAGAAATVAMPVVAGAFALGSIGASAVAIYSKFNEDEKNGAQ